MVLKYSEHFTVTNPLSHKPFTIIVECLEGEGFQRIVIDAIEGAHNPTEEHRMRLDKMRGFIPMGLPDARRLVDALTGALQAAQEP